MKKVLCKNKKAKKVLLSLFFILSNLKTNCMAAVVQEAGTGGNIASSTLFQGFYNIAIDLTGTLQWIIPVVRFSIYSLLCI